MSFYTNVKIIGNNVCYRGVENGLPVKFKYQYSPKVFTASQKESKFKTLTGSYVEEFRGTIQETREFIKKYEAIDNFEILGDIGFQYQYISDKFNTGDITWNINDISIHIIDIETGNELGVFPDPLQAREEILLISMLNLATKNVTVFTSREYSGDSIENTTIILCKNEKDLLLKFIDYWNKINIEVISGWNIDNFDVPYIVNRISNVLGDDHVKKLSPWGIVRSKTAKGFNGKEDITYEISGISSLDMMKLYKKFSNSPRESYSLDFICQEELSVGKLDHSQYVDFKEFYTKDYNLYLQYNVVDTQRVSDLEDKLKLIELCLTVAYFAKINYEDGFSPIKTWDVIIYNHLKEQNIVIPKNSHSNKGEKYEGAYVKEPIPGIYKWITSFDAASLYPSIIQGWNISPETYIGMSETPIDVDGLLDKKYDLSDKHCTAANGALFSKEKKGLFPELVDIYMQRRKDYKKPMLQYESELEELKLKINSEDSSKTLLELKHTLENTISKYNNSQMAMKILMNSLYGAIGNSHFRYYKLENARAITLTGQYIIKAIEIGLNEDLSKLFKLNTIWVKYMDTDSCYLSLETMVDKFYKNISNEKLVPILERICIEKIATIINKHCDNIQDYTHNFRKTIFMKLESIAPNGIFVSKKRYFMNVLYNEGVYYSEPKMKVMGLEVVKSSTPGVVRKSLKKALSVILDGGELAIQDYIYKCKKEFCKFSVEEISFPRGVNGLIKYADSKDIYSKGTPIHTKGALLYNHRLVELGLENKYSKINDGDKIKFSYLKEPNPTKNAVIAYPSDLPPEFGLHDFIDYNKQFEKSFLAPLELILNAVKWKSEKTNSIEDFFN